MSARALQALGAPILLALRALREAVTAPPSGTEVLAQLRELGLRSLPLVSVGMACFGIVMVTTAQQQARLFVGNITVVGPAYFELLVRELGPMACSLLAAARASASISAELASMKVNEQLEAWTMCGGNPLGELVAPRILATALSFPILFLLGTCAASASAVATVSLVFGADGLAFVDGRYVGPGDVLSGLAKSLLAGLFVPAAACRRALTAGRGASGVGTSVTQGVVDSAIGCLIADLLVTIGWLLVAR